MKQTMKESRFIYFDVGGVLLLDYSGTNKWTEMKRDLGVTEDLDEVFDSIWGETRDRICLNCDVDRLITKFENATGLIFPSGYSMLDDFVNRFEKNDSIWKVAEKAKEKYKVGLLTNMYPRMLNKIIEKGLLPNIDWDVIVDSSIVGYKKPQDEIYEIAEVKSGFLPDKIFFVDNQQRHTDSASNRGWTTMVYDPRSANDSSLKLAKVLELDLKVPT